jgi:phytoene dehydrogenase-like protein
MKATLDAAIIGSGPNGLAAAVALAREGYAVTVFEGAAEPGGGARTRELTLPGFHHDVCSAIHPMGLASPFLRGLDLGRHGLEWIHPEIPLAHPLDQGQAVAMHRSIEETAAQFSTASARSYRRIFAPLLQRFDDLLEDLLAPPQWPRHPLSMTAFGLRILPSTLAAARAWFDDEGARALFAGNAAHSVLPLDRPISSQAIGLMLMLAGHAKGWPIAKGGSQNIVSALLAELASLGGTLETGRWIRSLADLPKVRVCLFDTSPSALVAIAGGALPGSYSKRLLHYRHAPGIFKIDYALDGPVPWTAGACRRAGTVHVGGFLDEMTRAEREVFHGIHPERPFVLTAQQSLFDPTRAPKGKHTFWAYCHVPVGSTLDMTDRIEAQIERFAPGFRDLVLARHAMNCADYERYNPNLIGGDIVGGMTDWTQLLTRPVASLKPHTTPNPAIYLCSASTPPGGGVHGMCGYWAAREALNHLRAGSQ